MAAHASGRSAGNGRRTRDQSVIKCQQLRGGGLEEEVQRACSDPSQRTRAASFKTLGAWRLLLRMPISPKSSLHMDFRIVEQNSPPIYYLFDAYNMHNVIVRCSSWCAAIMRGSICTARACEATSEGFWSLGQSSYPAHQHFETRSMMFVLNVRRGAFEFQVL